MSKFKKVSNGELTIENVIEVLMEIQPPDEDFPEFDTNKGSDPVYCIEWGMLKQRMTERTIYQLVIEELKRLNV